VRGSDAVDATTMTGEHGTLHFWSQENEAKNKYSE
jgi:hypothetical protein